MAVGSEIAAQPQHNQDNSTPDDGRDHDREHDAFCRSEIIAFGSRIWRVSGIPCRRFATQMRDEVWIGEFNSAEATPLPARPSTPRDGLSLVVLPFFLLAQHVFLNVV